MADKRHPPLPPPESSIALATYRFEEIARAIQRTVRKKKAVDVRARLATPLEGYAHFRRQAFELVSHYLDNDLQAAFTWLLAMHGNSPKRARGSIRGNDFHLGLLAMTAAAGEFMHRNKLRDLSIVMQLAYAEGISKAGFEAFVKKTRKDARESRVVVGSRKGLQIASRREAVRERLLSFETDRQGGRSID